MLDSSEPAGFASRGGGWGEGRACRGWGCAGGGDKDAARARGRAASRVFYSRAFLEEWVLADELCVVVGEVQEQVDASQIVRQ